MKTRAHSQERHRLPSDRMFGWIAFGGLLSLLMLGGIGTWSMFTKIDGAVIAPGLVAPEFNRKTVQHLEGGIVEKILVREGDYVETGQPLIRLGNTQDRSELDIVRDRLANLTARRARLQTELDGSDMIHLPGSVAIRLGETKIGEIVSNEEQLFVARRDSRKANETLLERRAAALTAQIQGLKKQSASLREELKLTREETSTLEPLLKRRLVPVTRVLEVRRSLSRLQSQISGTEAQSQSLAAQVEENRAQLAQQMATFREDTAAQLASAQAEIHSLVEQKVAIDDRLKRRLIVAPQSGRVLNLGFHTTGGVITPGQSVMEIVPVDDRLVLLARVPVTEVERVFPDQSAIVRFTAFNRNTTPELQGTIESVSADTLIEPETGLPYYSAKVRLSETERAKLDGEELVAGMPAEVLISTGERLVASYLMRPLADSYSRTFRDE